MIGTHTGQNIPTPHLLPSGGWEHSIQATNMSSTTNIDSFDFVTEADVKYLINKYPNLCYEGWRTPRMTGTEFKEARDKLAASRAEINLCSRVFADPIFMKTYHGVQTAYRLKHVVERWDFDPQQDSHPQRTHYNGMYICEGVATAAALLACFKVKRMAMHSVGSKITVPRKWL